MSFYSTLVAAGLPVVGVAFGANPNKVPTVPGTYTHYFALDGTTVVGVDWSVVPSGAQDSAAAAIVNAFDLSPSGVAASLTTDQRAYALTILTSTAPEAKALRAIMLGLIDTIVSELNILRSQVIGITTVTIDPPNLTTGTGVTSGAITVTGAAFGDVVDVVAPYDLVGITATGYVSAADTVRARIQNGTPGAINLGSGIWTVIVRRPIVMAPRTLGAAVTAVKAAAVSHVNDGSADNGP